MRCDQCEIYKYGFSSEGCKSCDCDRIGSKSLQCDASGQCPCFDNVEGRQCNRCKENKYDRQRGCVDCPACYNLVQDAARNHTSKLERLREILDEIERNPTVIDDTEFETELSLIQENVKDLNEKAKNKLQIDGKSVPEKINDIQKRQDEIERSLSQVEENINLATKNVHSARHNISYGNQTLNEARSQLDDARESLETQGKIILLSKKFNYVASINSMHIQTEEQDLAA